MRAEGDVCYYALGTGEYDELNCEHDTGLQHAVRLS